MWKSDQLVSVSAIPLKLKREERKNPERPLFSLFGWKFSWRCSEVQGLEEVMLSHSFSFTIAEFDVPRTHPKKISSRRRVNA